MCHVYNKILLFISTLLLLHALQVHMMDPEMTASNYGPYNLEISRYQKCKGPKPKELAKFDYTVVSSKDNKYIVTHNFTFHEQGRLDEVKIIVYNYKDKTRRVLYSYRIQKPCQHFIIAEAIRIGLKATDCVVKKGLYTVTTDYLEYTKIFFGKEFFYGDVDLKINVISSKGNILCLIVNYNFKKISRK